MAVFASAPLSGSVRYLCILTSKIDEVAERAGVLPAARLDLETCLAALPWRARRHLTLVLESVRVHANSPALQNAVQLMLKLAGEIWAEEPYAHPDHRVSRQVLR
jgi:hypothetical protein